MNRTNVEHAAFAMLIQLPFLLTGHAWCGAFVASAFFLAREHAQYEKKMTHGGVVNGLSPMAGFAFLWRGSLDAKLDFYLAAMTVFAVAALYHFTLGA